MMIYFDWPEDFMNRRRARFVRHLRVDKNGSWRWVAQKCHEKWRQDWNPPSNQIVGMDLCKMAAPFFNENWSEEPWN